MWFLILLIALLIRFIFAYAHFHDSEYSIQQDGYADYAVAMKKGILDNENIYTAVETRLFPGYPFLIFLLSYVLKSEIISGLFISITASILSVYLIWRLTKKIGLFFIFAFFPPRWIEQSTKVATEPVTVFLLLFSIFLYKRNLFLLTGILIGLSLNVRLISICLLIVFLILLLKKKQLNQISNMVFGFVISGGLLFIFNYFIFGQNELFRQFSVTHSSYNITIGLFQIIRDLSRAIDWQQYRILISGLFYLFINIASLFFLFRVRGQSLLNEIMLYWMGLSLMFVFLLGPVPMLEEFGRFTTPFVPAMLYGLYIPFQDLLKKRINNFFINKRSSVA